MRTSESSKFYWIISNLNLYTKPLPRPPSTHKMLKHPKSANSFSREISWVCASNLHLLKDFRMIKHAEEIQALFSSPTFTTVSLLINYMMLTSTSWHLNSGCGDAPWRMFTHNIEESKKKSQTKCDDAISLFRLTRSDVSMLRRLESLSRGKRKKKKRFRVLKATSQQLFTG